MIFILALIAITVIPVMISAKLLGAEKTTFLRCLFAVIASVAAGSIAEHLIANAAFSGVIAVGITALCFSLITL